MLKNSFSSIDFLGRALDGSWVRNIAISNNIANVNTPNYKKETVDFETVLKNQLNMNGQIEMTKTDEQHMTLNNTSEFSIETVDNTSYRVDDNNVDIDVETAELAKNTVYYNAVVNEVNNQFSRIKAALSINK